MAKQGTLPIVEETAKQSREAESQKWDWVEAEVWTGRMLTTLENGVKGGRWFSLIDKVYGRRSLEEAWRKVRRKKGAAGVDGQKIQKFEKRLERELEQLHQELKEDRYHWTKGQPLPEALAKTEAYTCGKQHIVFLYSGCWIA